jgi:DUF438 domain-containing protein
MISRAQTGKEINKAPGSRKKAKVSKVMKEFKQGKLKSGGSGKTVKKKDQAIAIALSEAGISKRGKRNGKK